MAAEILGLAAGSPGTAPARTSSRASPPPCWQPATPSSACSRSTRARCPRSRAACGRAPCASGTSSVTSSTATASSSTSPSAGGDAVRDLPAGPSLVVNGGRPAGRRPRARPRAARSLRPRRPAPRAARAPARRGLEVVRALRDAVRVRRRVRRPSRRLPLSRVRPRPPGARRRRAGASSSTASRQRRSTSSRPRAASRVELRLPGLYNVYNALAAASLALALGASLDEIASGLERFERGVRALRADPDRRPAAADAADQEPGRRERGRADAVDGRRAARSLLVALNDAIADGQDVSWIWDVDFEPLLGAARARRRVGRPRGRARPALHVRRARPRSALEVEPGARAGARPRARADARRAASSSSSPRTRRCSRCARSSPSAGSCGRTGRRRVKIASATSIPTT